MSFRGLHFHPFLEALMSHSFISYCLLAVSSLAMGVTASRAAAATLLDVDFDTHNPDFPFSYNFKSTGGSITMTAAVTDGVGVGGSRAYSSNIDSTNAPQGAGTYWGAGNAVEVHAQSSLSGVTSAADLTYSLDTRASGLSAGRTTASLRLILKFIDSSNSATLWQTTSNFTYNTPGSFQTVTGDLSTASTNSGSLSAAVASPSPLLMRAQVEISNGAGHFGYDADNVLTIDNLLVSSVPEPASMALLTMGGLGLAGRRGRRRE
jgi:hypothetical protein